MSVELFDDIAESTVNPSSATDGWGSLEENANRFWYNTTTRIMFRHNGTDWVSYDSADGMEVNRSSLTLTSNTGNSIKLENNAGNISLNGKSVLSSNGQFSTDGITLTGSNSSSLNIENINGSLAVNGTPIGGIQTGTEAQMLAISRPIAGQQFLTCPSDLADSKLCYYNGETWQVSGETFQTLSAEALPIGSVVEGDTTYPDRVRKTQSTRDKDIVGVVVFSEATKVGENITVAYAGRWNLRCEGGSYVSYLYISTASTNGIGKGYTKLESGTFCRPLETKTISLPDGLLKCILFGAKR